MKNYIFLFFLFLLSSKVFSQGVFSNYEIGYFYDINYQIIDGYYDENYQPKKSLKVSYTIGEDFTPGYYYDLENHKISGLIKYTQRNAFFKFKSDYSSKQQTITPDESLGYVIGLDSFAVIQNFSVERRLGSFQSTEKEYAEVIERVGNLTFYKHARVGSDNIVSTYLVKDDNVGEYVSFSKGINNFIKTSILIFGEFGSLKAQILREEYESADIPTMVKLLKYKRKYDNKEKIFYNSSWDEVDDINKSSYYANIESVRDSIFHLKFFFNNNTPIYEGNFYSFYPHKKTGVFIWYYPNGAIRKKVNYSKNNEMGATTYFKDGKIHYEYKLADETYFYSKVFNLNGEEILDSLGNGTEKFYDSIVGRKLTYAFIHNKIVNAYFLDSNNRRVYQLCPKNAKLQPLQAELDEGIKYPNKSIENFTHGFVFVKCIVESTGLVSDIQIIKGLDAACDSSILGFLSYIKTHQNWLSAKVKKEKVTQELIIPVDFSINSFSRYRNNYYYDYGWWMQQQMMTPPPIPSYVH